MQSGDDDDAEHANKKKIDVINLLRLHNRPLCWIKLKFHSVQALNVEADVVWKFSEFVFWVFNISIYLVK